MIMKTNVKYPIQYGKDYVAFDIAKKIKDIKFNFDQLFHGHYDKHGVLWYSIEGESNSTRDKYNEISAPTCFELMRCLDKIGILINLNVKLTKNGLRHYCYIETIKYGDILTEEYETREEALNNAFLQALKLLDTSREV